ncbi:MAG: CIA30 family protein [Fibrobacter sp.]|nr:CIA30 family protein [Fibrobacter sp.]
MRKIDMCFAAAFLAVLFFTACGDSESSPAGPQASPASSSIVPKSSSSANSSSSLEECTEKCVGRSFLWDGMLDTEGKVVTGSTEKSSGLWRTFNDSAYGGSSRIIFPYDVKPDEYGNFFGPLICAYGGIEGEASLGDGYDYPYAGLEFDVWSANKEGADISLWKGLCLEYVSMKSFYVELVVENDSSVTESNNYRASVSASEGPNVVSLPWDKFRQGRGWGKIVSQEDVLRKTAMIRLTFEGYATFSSEFRIMQIGSLGACAAYADQ